ncbi:beta/gamma crystallin family protein [Fulvivirga maritima]|uniref:beta/gamma crystallin family protein n=1 Tax=Fulvivirga maritima TaxID=2904247 RepID=UPI001F16A17D|nr:beta/gamma crystallin family protein [Fulvivirga maritima]UII26920.1 beta/gamma crystallin family protein [Fulvivirga maritima]
MKTLKRTSLFSKAIIALYFTLFMSCKDHIIEEMTDEKATAEQAVVTSTQARTSADALVKRWAPIHYMDVDVTGTYAENGKSDYITAINYDGDWNAENNWENLSTYGNDLYAHVYYSVVETSTHWYIIYAFFHPRDWTDIALLYYLDQHENDLEGILMMIEKDGSTYGALRGAVTVSHSDFFSFTPSGSPLTNGHENIDGTLQFANYNGEMHPVTAQEAKGHGLKAWPQYDINGDGIIYYPSMNDIAEKPADEYDNHVEYKLVNIFESNGLWAQRNNTALFYDAGGDFRGNNFKDGGANAPWAWNDGNDGIVNGGEMATDPAKLFDNYFEGISNISHIYTSNTYNPNGGGVATLYEDCNYRGYAVSLPVGDYTLSQLESRGISNDDVSSLRVENGYKVVLYWDNNFSGSSITKTSNEGCLGNQGWNDELSSVRVMHN